MNNSHFRYNPKNHCWHAVGKALLAITIGTLLMGVCEALALYETKKILLPSSRTVFIIIGVLALVNTFVLRKHVRIIRNPKNGSTRFIAYTIVAILSFMTVLGFMNTEADARAVEIQAQRLEGIEFDKADYFRIANPGCIDTTRIGYDIGRNIFYSRSGMSSLSFIGYFVVPFHDNDSVFYAITSEHRGSMPFLKTEEARHRIWQQFTEVSERQRQSLQPEVQSGLFKRIMPDEDSPYWVAIGYSCAKDSVSHDIYAIQRSVLLSPVESGCMPEWQDTLRNGFTVFGFIMAFLATLFVFAKTSGYQHRKKKTQRQ